MNKQTQATPLAIFIAFLRLGLTAFGGPAMVAYIRRMAVRDKKWVTEGSFKKGVALCQAIPGATAMQVAAYSGLRAGGPWGAVSAYVAFTLPAFVLMVILSALYSKAHGVPELVSLFTGLQVIVIALMANATISFGRSYIKRKQDILLVAGSALYLGLGGSPIIAILCSGALGIFLYRSLYLDLESAAPVANKKISWKMIRPALVVFLLFVLFLTLLNFLRPDLFTLSLLMVKIDFFAFGGGYASVPLMFHEVVDVHQWMNNQSLMDGIALGQITPGPIVITATFVGYLFSGLPGAVVGTISIFTPSLFILLLVVPYFDRLQHNAIVQRVLRGVLVSFVGLLLAVTIRFALTVHWTPLSILIGACAFAALWKKVNILWVVLVGAVLSILLF